MQSFFQRAERQNNPLRILETFLEKEAATEKAKNYTQMRLAGGVLDIGYDKATVVTSDPLKLAVGGLPRNSLLVMVPENLLEDKVMPPHFTLLRVLAAAETPLSEETARAYFELQKRSMPELDVFTQSELQWGALETAVLGMFYPHPELPDKVEFSGDVNNFVSAYKYRVYSPTSDVLDLIVNSLVPVENRFVIGYLRLTECRLQLPNAPIPTDVPVFVSSEDFMGTRTALFGKTRLGKSNVVKFIAASLIETTRKSDKVGQLIFDLQGEYANDNPQDDSHSLASAYPDRCEVYALSPKPATKSKPLKLNFYDHPEASLKVLRALLRRDQRVSIYITNFADVQLPTIEDLNNMPFNDKLRAQRRILMYWAILRKAGYDVDEAVIRQKVSIDPNYHQAFRQNVYSNTQPILQQPPNISNLNDVLQEFERIALFARGKPLTSPDLQSTSGNPLFDRDEQALLEFLKPAAGVGPGVIQAYRKYHDKNAGNFSKEILDHLDKGFTIILDLGNADPEVMEYFSYELSSAIFATQVDKFSNNKLGDHYVQLYFEEAHNLFPKDEKNAKDIYQRIAKEGAKYHIGMVFATQSVTSVNSDLLDQTENFFIAHLSSQDEVTALARVNVAYATMKEDIMQTKTKGYIRLLTRSHRFVIPTQVKKFTAIPLAQ